MLTIEEVDKLTFRQLQAIVGRYAKEGLIAKVNRKGTAEYLRKEIKKLIIPPYDYHQETKKTRKPRTPKVQKKHITFLDQQKGESLVSEIIGRETDETNKIHLEEKIEEKIEEVEQKVKEIDEKIEDVDEMKVYDDDIGELEMIDDEVEELEMIDDEVEELEMIDDEVEELEMIDDEVEELETFDDEEVKKVDEVKTVVKERVNDVDDDEVEELEMIDDEVEELETFDDEEVKTVVEEKANDVDEVKTVVEEKAKKVYDDEVEELEMIDDEVEELETFDDEKVKKVEEVKILIEKKIETPPKTVKKIRPCGFKRLRKVNTPVPKKRFDIFSNLKEIFKVLSSNRFNYFEDETVYDFYIDTLTSHKLGVQAKSRSQAKVYLVLLDLVFDRSPNLEMTKDCETIEDFFTVITSNPSHMVGITGINFGNRVQDYREFNLYTPIRIEKELMLRR